jgi:hypothetical protein
MAGTSPAMTGTAIQTEAITLAVARIYPACAVRAD